MHSRDQIHGSMYFKDSRRSEYDSGFQYTKILYVSGVLVYYSFKGYINRVLNIPRVPNVLKL